LARGVAAAGERAAPLIGKAPLIPRGQLHFLTSHAVPLAERARRDLGWSPRPFREVLPETLRHLEGAAPPPR
jgi:hypothetical protein